MNDEIKTNAKNKMIQSLEGLEKRFSTVACWTCQSI